MFRLQPRPALLSLLLSCAAAAQVVNIAAPGDRFAPIDAMQTTRMDFNLFLIGSRNPHTTDVQSPSTSVSRLDLKAPGKARREYEQGYKLLMRKDLQGAVEHLAKSISIFPKFVAAHNALGTAYLDLGENEQARGKFAQAVALDDHLPNSYLNLGCAELALKQYPEAEEALRKASSIAPLDVQLQLALAYGEFLNKDYSSLLATSRQQYEKGRQKRLVRYLEQGATSKGTEIPK
jgi:Flp pilus assembly protein TadD